MAGTIDTLIQGMTIKDCGQVYRLRADIRGLGIRSIDDSREGAECFLRRNPTANVVAVQDGLITGDIPCGHDGRTGCFYHVCVAPGYRKYGIGYRMARTAMEALQREGMNKVSLIASKNNKVGSAFWQGAGWIKEEDANGYKLILSRENITYSVC